MSPLWGFSYWYALPIYKHAAPLGLSAAKFKARHPSWGLSFQAQRVGGPNPYGFNRALRYHMSPLWGFGCLVYAAFYKHVAPLGLNAAMRRNLRHCIHRRGLVSKPSGLGGPTPTGLTVRYGITCRPCGALVYAAFYKHVAPLGLSAAKLAARHPS